LPRRLCGGREESANDVVDPVDDGFDSRQRFARAKLFGYPTFWVNRLGLPPERFGPMPDGSSADLDPPVALVG
jgi:hypothetical protein